MDIRERLKEAGFYKAISATTSLQKQALDMACKAGSETQEPAFEAFASYIPAYSGKPPHGNQLVIDVGGTSTKAGFRVCDQAGFEHWHILFELKNDILNASCESSSALECFAISVAENLHDNLRRVDVDPSGVSTCAIVWSNAMVNKLIDDGTGITGQVVQRERYHKGEWFIEGLENGTDIGQIFLKGFAAKDISISTFLIANDVPLTMKALPEAHGGIVASTGLNGTLVKSYEELGVEDKGLTEVICNAEMGGRFTIDHSLLSEADYVSSGVKADTMEFLSAGRFLPSLFTEHINLLSNSSNPELQRVNEHLKSLGKDRWNYFRAKDMSLLLSDKPHFLERRQEFSNLYSDEALNTLEILSEEIFVRAAKLCAVVAYGSVSNRLERLENPTVAVDSRLAREVPTFKNAFTQEVLSIAESHNTTIRCPLVLPVLVEGGKISVPMQGAAHALDSLT